MDVIRYAKVAFRANSRTAKVVDNPPQFTPLPGIEGSDNLAESDRGVARPCRVHCEQVCKLA
jgi:hypothetical protein